jgi:hypothetical protein
VASGSTGTTPQSAVLPELEPDEDDEEPEDEEPEDEEPDDEELDDEEPEDEEPDDEELDDEELDDEELDDEEPEDEEPDDEELDDEDPIPLELELLADPSSTPAPELDVELPFDVEASCPPPVEEPALSV